MTTFELVPDAEPEAGGPPLPGGDAPGDPTIRDRAAAHWHRLSRRARVAMAAGAVVVVLATTGAIAGPSLLDARADRLRAEAVRGLAGTVPDLSEPLQQTWEVPNGTGILAVLPRSVVVTTDGTDARAVDVTTGEDVWRHQVGADPVCGPRPSSVELDRPVDTVVCLGGEPDARTVTVLDASGTVTGERTVGAAITDPYSEGLDDDTRIMLPAADGAVVVVDDRTSGVDAAWSETGDADAALRTLRTLRERGWTDPTMRIEDAVTGEVRAEVTARLRPEGLEGCGQSYETNEEGTTRVRVIPDSSVDVTPSFAVLSACGSSVGLMADGSPLDASTSAGWLQAIAGGGFAATGEESRVHASDGSLVTTVPGWVVLPSVDADPSGLTLALTVVDERAEDMRLAAFGPDGQQAWAVPVTSPPGVAARVAGVVLLQDADRVLGLDAATGAELWAHDGLLDVPKDGNGEWVAGALTDGTRVLLGVGGSSGGSHRLVALDVRDGTTTWEREGKGHLNALEAVGGHPVLLTSTLHGLG